MLKTVRSTVNVDQITGVLPVVNGGTGVTTSTGTGSVVLSAAPTLSGNVSLSTGSLVISTSGKGIDFSATPGTGTSELLADYEEGTWTPTDASGAGLSFTLGTCTYTRVGRLITCVAQITFPATASGLNAAISGFPFATNDRYYGTINYSPVATTLLRFAQGTTSLSLWIPGAFVTNATMTGSLLIVSIVYTV
jgi:autotransporter-associated beta strand protein